MRQINLILLFTMVSLTVFSQGRKEEIRQQIESKKIAYLTEHLDLNPEDSQKFWPLYNAYNKENESINKGIREKMDGLSADEKLDMSVDLEQDKLNLKKDYISKFKAILGAEKTLEFFQFEREFRGRMLREIGEKRKQRQKRGY